ncbi:22963_t:CDS:2, partial [Dentiscutata erythropus]
MSFAEVGESLGPITATAQQTTNFHYYNTQGDSDNEHDYVGTPPYSNDESTLEGDNSEEGMEGVSDNEQITQNILPVQNQGFEGGSDFNTYRNGNGITSGNVIDVGNNNLNNSNNGNTANNMLPPIQMLHRNTPPSIPASTLSAPSSSTRSLGSDIQFSDRLLAFNTMHARNLNNRDLRQNHHVGSYNIPPFPDGFPVPQPQSIFRFPNVSQPPSYTVRNDVTVSQSTTTSSNVSQQKQSPLRFANSSSSRKRARSISNDWPNTTSNSHFIPSSIQFGSLEPINRDGIGGRSTVGNNLQASTRSSSPLNRSTPGNHAPVINNYQDVTDSPSTPLSPPINYMPHYIPHPNRIPTYVAYNQPSSNSSQSSSSIPIRPQSQQNFFNRMPYVSNASRRNFPNPTQPLDTSLRRPSHHTSDEQQSYNNYTSVGSEASNVIYPEVVSSQPERRQHHSNVNVHIQNVSQGPRGSSSSRWTSRDSSNRNRDVLTRSIIPNPHLRRTAIRPSTFTGAGNHSTLNGPLQESSRVIGSDEEPDTAIDLPESSDSEVNITTTPNRVTPWTNRIIRRHDIRQDSNTRDSRQPINHRTLVPSASTTNAARNNSSENPISDEQLTRRIQPTEFSSTHQNLNDEHSPLSRIFGSRVRPSSRRDTGTNSSTTSRSGSVRRDTPTRAPIPRLPDMLSHHDRHHSEERGSESRSRAHGLRNGQSRNVRQGAHYIHHFIPHYPLLENLIDNGELEDYFIEMMPEFLGNGIAANPDNYLDEDEFDSSYEGLLRLSERIGDAKPKGVPDHVVNTLPTKRYSTSKTRSLDERYLYSGKIWISERRWKNLIQNRLKKLSVPVGLEFPCIPSEEFPGSLSYRKRIYSARKNKH